MKVAIHTDQVTPGCLFVALRGKHRDGHEFVEEAFRRGAADALVERGPGTIVPNTLKALQNLAAEHRKNLKTQVIAITGSFGKTVTKDLLCQILSVKYRVSASPDSYNSQIGVPLSILNIDPEDEFAIIEVGVSKMGEMDEMLPIVRPDHAILTCIGNAHLATMGSIETTLQEKQKLLEAAKGWIIDPTDNPIVFPTSKTGDFEVQLDPPFAIHFNHAFPHLRHVLNQCVRAAYLCGLTAEEILQGLNKGLPTPIRTGMWRSPYGTTFIDDTPSSDPLSIEQTKRLLNRATQPAELFKKLTPQDVLSLNQLTINLDRVRQNVEAVKHPLIAVLKANAYGTDAVQMAKFLSLIGVKIFAVAYVQEAVQLRLAGIEEKILVFHVAPYEVDQVGRWNLTPCVGTRELIDALAPCTIHLNIDTGMSRLGCKPQEVPELLEACKQHKLEGVMTHLACANDPSQDAVTEKQLATFFDVTRHLDLPYKHAHATAGIQRFDLGECNAVRMGIGLYEDAVTLTSRIAAIHTLKQGDRVSYGGTYTVEEQEERVGVLPLGYFDGIQNTHVLIGGEPAPIVGTVCMDFCMVKLKDANVHDPVLIFGEDAFGNRLSMHELAPKPHKLIACLGPRIQRIFLYEGVAREIACAQDLRQTT